MWQVEALPVINQQKGGDGGDSNNSKNWLCSSFLTFFPWIIKNCAVNSQVKDIEVLQANFFATNYFPCSVTQMIFRCGIPRKGTI
jgi:hypothetical protein